MTMRSVFVYDSIQLYAPELKPVLHFMYDRPVLIFLAKYMTYISLTYIYIYALFNQLIFGIHLND